jgi:drug/metabolite transporter (DMT)-like permease
MFKKPRYLSLILVAFIWSTTNFITTDLLNQLGPFSILICRFSVAVIILTTYLLTQKKNIFKDFKVGMVTGIFLALFYSMQNLALQHTGPVNTSFFLNSFIIFIPFLAYIIEKKPIVKWDFLTVFLAVMGIYLIGGNLGGFKSGDFIALGGAVFYGLYMVISNKYAAKEDIVVEVNQQFIWVILISIIGSLLNHESIPVLTSNSIIQLLYLAILPSITCFLILNWAQQNSNPLLVSLIVSLDGVFSAIIGLILGSIQFSIFLLLGILLFQIAILTDSQKFRDLLETKK